MHHGAASYLRGPLMTIVLCSGGLDSVILAHRVSAERSGTHVLSFNYGQRHKKELEFQRRCAERIGAKHSIVDITDVGRSPDQLSAGGAARPSHSISCGSPFSHLGLLLGEHQ